ncbi:MAG TPA: D-alanyl-D-alanine carboxypeptidase family protein [Bacillota bacterium]
MKKYFRLWPVFYLALLGAVMLGQTAGAAGRVSGEANLKLDSYAAILIEPTSGEILFQKNQSEPLPPASVTKLMVMLLALEAVDKNQIKLTDVVTASPEACRMGGSQIWLEPGEQMTVAELMKAVSIVSANDASYALAEHLAGSEENFITLMNKRCNELGLKSTHYVNTTGLSPEDGGTGNITSVEDQARLAMEVIKHPLVFKWTGTWIDSLRGGKSFLRNTNNLVRFFRGCDGLKTGFTNAAGFCLVATAKRDGVRLVAVVMKSPASETRSKDITKLFNYGFSKFKAYQVFKGGETIGQVRVFRGRQAYVDAVVPGELTAIVKRDFQGKVIKRIRLYPVIQAPVKTGQKIGAVELSVEGKNCGRIDLTAAKSVERASFFEICWQAFQNLIRVGVR